MGILQQHVPATDPDDIAVIGIACRFPGGASDPEKFWELLFNKKSGFCTAPQSRYNAGAFHHEAREKLNTLSASGGHFLEEDVSAFDAPFFNITAQEATAMDPTARMLLEVTYEAMENAGLPIENLVRSNTSCYVGCFTRDYHEMLMRDAETAPMYAGTGTGFSLLSNRVSWFYDLRGPSMTLDTACSSSMVGLHVACQGLRNGESNIALVCGANLILSPDLGMWLSNLHMTSTDGLSRSFADGVTGYGRGEGIATIVLKPLRDALRDGDPIRSVIKGTGVNQDGHTTGITVPNRDAQADLIRSTYKSAGLDVSQTSYFEAHGTGTGVGDPLELGAVAQAISTARSPDDPLYVGSVKSNIGHLEGAAGLAGIIKCIMMLEHGAILPNIHFEKPSKRIPFKEWKIEVPTEITPWPKNRPHRASVNSFGYGGTNAHVIIDSADQATVADRARITQNGHQEATRQEKTRLFVFSAPAESALHRMLERTREHLLEVESKYTTQTPSADDERTYLDRLAFTLSDRRSQFPWKAVVVANTLNELAEGLSTNSTLAQSSKKPRIAFVFTGQGAQWAQMGIELWEYPIFRESVQDADLYLRNSLSNDWSVVAELEKDATSSSINLAHISQPLCTVLQIAFVDLLKSWKIEPTGVVGHSSGEIAAAYCCGAFSREEAWSVAYHRGKACLDLNNDPSHVKGAMMAVGLSAEEARDYLRDVTAGTIVIACVNSPSSVTISGDATGIDELQETLATKGVFCRKLQVEHAYHSHHMKRVSDSYLQHISGICPKEAPENGVHMISSVTGKPINNDQLGPDYWVQNFVSPVLFTDAVSALLQDHTHRRRRARAGETAFDVLLEVGPHSALKGPLRQILQQHSISTVTYASVLLRGENAVRTAIRAAGELCVHGASVNISQVNCFDTKPKPLSSLPSYPFDHSLHYWAESRLSRNYRFRHSGRHDLLGAPAADTSVDQPRWRNILRVQEQPWLRDHMVHSSILYPASGSLVMVLEAVRQLTAVDRQIESIKLEQVRITKAIVVPNDQTGIETVLQLHHDEGSADSSQDSWQFFVLSCSDGTSLEQNSSGRVTVRYTTETGKSSASWTTGKQLLWQKVTEEYKTAMEQCTRSVDSTAFYTATREAGLQYGPQFQGLENISAGSDRCATVVNVTDTKASMPGGAQSPHLIHPTTLDVIFHSMFTAMGKEGLDFSNAAVPIAFDSLIFYTDLPSSPGSKFSGCCNINRDGSRDLVADIYVSDIDWKEPKIIVKGIRCRELPPSDTENPSRGPTKAPVGTLVWKPDITFLGESQLKNYIADVVNEKFTQDMTTNGENSPSWEAEVGVVVDLVAHHSPDLSILQIGHFGPLVNSLLPILGASPGKTIRCSKYTILDPDQERIARCVYEFHESCDIVSFGPLDAETVGDDDTLEEKSLDIVIVNSGFINVEQVQSLKKFLRPQGIMVIQTPSLDESDHPYMNGHLENEVTKSWSLIKCSPTSSWVLGRKQQITSASDHDKIITLLEPINSNPEVAEISRQLSIILDTMGVRTETVQWSTEVSGLQGKTIVSLLELPSAFLRDITAEDYAALKTMALNSARLLWVAMGNDPVMQAAIGYLRVLQNENSNLDLRYLLLEERVGRSVENIAQTLAPVVIAPTTDREYMEVNGSLRINRWVNDEQLSSIMDINDSQKDLKFIPLATAKTPLRLLHESTKSQTLYGAIDQDWRDSLAVDEVEISVKAIGLDGQDRVSDNAFVVEFSGIITKTGQSCNRLKQGDPVWGCVAASAYQTFFRVKEDLCQLVPPTATFEEAVSWPVSLGTAYAALIDKARLQQGQTILIQAAVNAIGQFAIQLALQQGAQVLATVSSEEQRGEIESLGVGAERVLNNNDPDLAAAILGLTHGKGPNVILNQFSTGKTLQCLWTSIAASGILIDINPDSPSSDDEAGLSMAPLRRGASYTVLDISKNLQEKPLQIAKILDCVSQLKPNEVFRKPSPQTTWQAAQAADAVKWARSQTHHGQAVLAFGSNDRVPVTSEVANPLILEANGTYLLVGGTGGLGANLAMFLAQKGARHLAVVSRSGPASKNADSFTQSLTSIGVNVKLYAADVSEEAAMKQVLDQCTAEMPPIRGVIQCAAVLDDSIYNNMTHEQWRNATRPKIHGSWILHHLLPRDLQFFIMLSSIAGVVGNRSQANYAAGNTYQDALAQYRRSQGLPAVSVDLGLMLGIGLIAERGGVTNLRKWEAVGIHEEEFHLLITAAIAGSWNSCPLPTQVISGLPTGGILESEGLERPFYFDDRRFAYLKENGLDLNKDQQKAKSKAAALSSQLAKVSSTREATELIIGGLSQRLARELQKDVENIDPSHPLHSYGVDSLLAVDIRSWILADLQAELSLFDVLGSGSIQALATRIASISKAVPESVRQQ